MEPWRGAPRRLSFVTVAIGVAALYFARPVLAPLAAAALLSVIFAPLVKRIERLGIGRFAVGRVGAVLVAAVLVGGSAVGFGWIVSRQASALTEQLPSYQRAAMTKLRALRTSVASWQRTAKQIADAVDVPGASDARTVELVQADDQLVGMLRGWVGSLASILATAGIVCVLLAFLLIEREHLRDRLIRVIGGGNLPRSTAALDDASQRVSRYLRNFALLNVGHGTVVGLGLWALGLPGAPVFGLMAGVLRFIPYLGPWIAGLAPIALSLAVFPGWQKPIEIGAFLAAVELVSNNFIEPKLYGSSVGLSPLAVIFSAVFWAWIWGPLGLVLATPLTVCVVVLGRHVPQLEPIATLLSDRPALEPHERLYQRVLARDVDEAADLVGSELESWDHIVVPALQRLDNDRQDRRLDVGELALAQETLRELVSETIPSDREASLPVGPTRILCLPAGDWPDEIVCTALATFLAEGGAPARAVGRLLTSELAEEVAKAPDAVVCISALNAGRGGALRHLLVRLRARAPEAELVIGAWGEGQSPAAIRERFAGDPRVHWVSTLAEARSQAYGLATALQS
jgi:predicted PurR-regulated permease PerM